MRWSDASASAAHRSNRRWSRDNACSDRRWGELINGNEYAAFRGADEILNANQRCGSGPSDRFIRRYSLPIYTSVIFALAHEPSTEFNTRPFAWFAFYRSHESQDAFESQRLNPHVVADLKLSSGSASASAMNVRLSASRTRGDRVVLDR